eukprot:13273_1
MFTSSNYIIMVDEVMKQWMMMDIVQLKTNNKHDISSIARSPALFKDFTTYINTNTRCITPSIYPTITPTYNPSKSPSNNLTKSSSNNPSISPSISPTKSPSNDPTISPTNNPSYNPSTTPTYYPTKTPSI